MPTTATIPKLSEKQITEQILVWLAMRGWYAERKQVGLFKRRVSIGRKGQADFTLTKKISDGQCFIFHLETKGVNARTDSKRVESQARWAAESQAIGQPVCRIPDRHPDPLAYFQTWYTCHFGAAS